MTGPALRVLLVDDHTLFRRGLSALLSRDSRLVVVGDAADAGEAQRRAQELQPDVILLDNHLPGVNGVDANGVKPCKRSHNSVLLPQQPAASTGPARTPASC